MTYDEIRTELSALVPLMTEKGLRLPEASLRIASDAKTFLALCHALPTKTWADQCLT